MNTTPEAERWPTLPSPEFKICETDYWVYVAPTAPESYGACKLRVYRSSDGGHIAIVTEITGHATPSGKPYEGLWITTGAPDIWRALTDEYAAPLTLIEHTPKHGEPDVYDQYNPAHLNGYDRRPISYIAPGHPDYDDVRSWWLAYRGYLVHGPKLSPGDNQIMSQDPKTWCDHDGGRCVLGRPDDADAHARLIEAVAGLDEIRAETFPALLGVDETKAASAAADWLDTIRITLTGDEHTEDHGTGNYLVTDLLMRPALEAHRLDPDDRAARDVVYAYGWYAMATAAATAPDPSFRLEPYGLTHIRNRAKTAAILDVASHMLRHGLTAPAGDQEDAEELDAQLPPMTSGTALVPHRALLNRYKLNESLKALGLALRTDITKGRIGDAAELSGSLAGLMMHTLFSLDPTEQAEDFLASYKGWAASFTTQAATPREHSDALAGALALHAMWTGHMLEQAANDRTRLRLGWNAKPGTMILAAKIAMTAGQLAVSATDRRVVEGYTYPEIAKNLRDYADMIDRLSVTHGPAVSTPTKDDQ